MNQGASSLPRGITRRTFHKLTLALAGAPAINGVVDTAGQPQTAPHRQPVVLRPVDALVVDVLIDNLSDNYSSKPSHVSPVVFSACSHAGVVNVVLDARKVFPDTPVYGVFGGLHLVGATMERIIPDTVTNLQELAPKQIMPAHCSGWRAVHALLNAFGESVITPSSVGSRYSF